MNSWTQIKDKLSKDFKFANFQEALAFVNLVADLAQDVNHHPDILLHDYNQVTLTLSTHSEGRVTERDFDLARKIDTLNPFSS